MKDKILEFEKKLKEKDQKTNLKFSKDNGVWIITTNFKDPEFFRELINDIFLKEGIFNFAFLFEEGKDDVLIKDFEIKKNQIERREIENKIEIKKVLFELVSILQTNNKNSFLELNDFKFFNNQYSKTTTLTKIGINVDRELILVDEHRIFTSLNETELATSDFVRLIDSLLDLKRKKR